MTIRRAVAGASLAAVLVLAACGSDEESPADDTPVTEDDDAGSPTDEDTDDGADDDAGAAADDADADEDATGDCPPLSEGANVEVSVLAQCSQAAMQETAGYAARTEILGLVSEVRVNTDPQAMHMDSDLGEVISIEGQTWVNVGDGWQEGDPDSADPLVAGLSAAADEVAEQADPTAQLEQMGEVDLTVTGTDTRLGEDVFVISGSGAEVDDMLYYVTADYAVLGADVQVSVEGLDVTSTVEVTEWDTPQEITAPM